MNTAKKLRSHIMEILFKIEDVATLKGIQHQLEKATKKKGENLSFMEAVKPIKDDVSLAEMMQEQNYKPVTYKEFRKKADKIKWDASLDELLDALKK